MAIIGKIRSYSGLLIITIGLALALFVLSDFLKNMGGDRDTTVAVINGETISYRAFNERVESEITNYKIRNNVTNVETEVYDQVRGEVWRQLIEENTLMENLDELGFTVSKDELTDMAIGNNIHPQIMQTPIFNNPETGQFDRNRVSEYIRNIKNPENQQNEEVKRQYFMWVNFEHYIKKERKRNKYFNAIKAGLLTSNVEAEMLYKEKNEKVKGRFVVKKYTEISDSVVDVSDNDIETYYNEHKELFKNDKEYRSADYVVFDVRPSAEDIKEIEEWAYSVKKGLDTIIEMEELVDYVNYESDIRFMNKYQKREELAKEIDTLFVCEENTVWGPYKQGSFFKVSKLLKKAVRPDSMKASHILISHKQANLGQEQMQGITRTKEQAQAFADSLFAELKQNSDNFDTLAVQLSDDPSAKNNGGDLSWFADGHMVKEFNEACVNGKVDDILMVETLYGFHIIKLTGKTEPIEKVLIATVEREVTPSKETFDSIYAKASKFTVENQTGEAFENTVKEEGMNVRKLNQVYKSSTKLPGLDNPKELMRWMFNEETEVGMVSKIFDMGERFVIATITDIVPEGYKPIEAVREQIDFEVRKQKKGDMLAKEFNQKSENAGNIDEIASAMNLQVQPVDNLTFKSAFIPGVGSEPELTAYAFTMEPNSVSKPIIGNRGVYVFVLDTKIDAPAVDDFKNEAMQQNQTIQRRVDVQAQEALIKDADITDNRLKFF